MNVHTPISRRHVVKGLAAAWAAAPLLSAQAVTTRRPPGLQLYTLQLTPKDDLSAALREISAIGYRTVELPGTYGLTATALKKVLDGAALSCPSIHAALSATPGMWDLSGDLSAVAADIRALGARYVVVPIPLLPDRITQILQHPPDGGLDAVKLSQLFDGLTEDDWKRSAGLLNEKAGLLSRSGIRVAYHNHGPDFTRLASGKTGYEIIVAQTDPALVDLELDVGWAVSAGQDLPSLFQRLGSRVKLLHLKDVKRVATHSMDLIPADAGKGIIDWASVARLVRSSHVEHMFVEQEPPFEKDPMAAARVDFEYLSPLFSLPEKDRRS